MRYYINVGIQPPSSGKVSTSYGTVRQARGEALKILSHKDPKPHVWIEDENGNRIEVVSGQSTVS